jgi:hypothetical protein
MQDQASPGLMQRKTRLRKPPADVDRDQTRVTDTDLRLILVNVA